MFENLIFDLKEPDWPKLESHNKKGNFNHQSILNDTLLKLLGFSNNLILNSPHVELLYNSVSSGSSFNRLANEIKYYNAPMLILIKNKF